MLIAIVSQDAGSPEEKPVPAPWPPSSIWEIDPSAAVARAAAEKKPLCVLVARRESAALAELVEFGTTASASRLSEEVVLLAVELEATIGGNEPRAGRNSLHRELPGDWAIRLGAFSGPDVYLLDCQANLPAETLVHSGGVEVPEIEDGSWMVSRLEEFAPDRRLQNARFVAPRYPSWVSKQLPKEARQQVVAEDVDTRAGAWAAWFAKDPEVSVKCLREVYRKCGDPVVRIEVLRFLNRTGERSRTAVNLMATACLEGNAWVARFGAESLFAAGDAGVKELQRLMPSVLDQLGDRDSDGLRPQDRSTIMMQAMARTLDPRFVESIALPIELELADDWVVLMSVYQLFRVGYVLGTEAVEKPLRDAMEFSNSQYADAIREHCSNFLAAGY